jgi:4-hydroxybenzoate polyprenyltransferase
MESVARRAILTAEGPGAGGGRLARAAFLPLWRRLETGEGALAAVNVAVLVSGQASVGESLRGAALAAGVLAHLYCFNDWIDAPADLSNPRKDSVLARTMIHDRRTIGVALAASLLPLLVLAAVDGGRRLAWALAVVTVNAAYSLRLKKIPLVDVAWVGVWGYSFVAMAGARAEFCGLIGIMTGICHVFQTLIDRRSDESNGLRTTAVDSPAMAQALLWLLCILLAGALHQFLGSAWAVTAIAPAVFGRFLKDRWLAWMASKTYFAAALLAVIKAPHGLA